MCQFNHRHSLISSFFKFFFFFSFIESKTETKNNNAKNNKYSKEEDKDISYGNLFLPKNSVDFYHLFAFICLTDWHYSKYLSFQKTAVFKLIKISLIVCNRIYSYILCLYRVAEFKFRLSFFLQIFVSILKFNWAKRITCIWNTLRLGTKTDKQCKFITYLKCERERDRK